MELAAIRPLTCFVDSYHRVQVGNASAEAIPEGAHVSFIARLETGGLYCTTVTLPKPILPHLFEVITNQRVFDDGAPCQAWREVTPVVQP